ncbi:MAG: acetyl-CoA hydrolase/transferase family protein [Azoarcus sp.]|jgi:succinyl-CoA:acetate CoA-transferase|nr:acetyl-CoA hydrolase/transferase family protein [Azoarcus sp.]
MSESRIHNAALRGKIMSADEAAAFIHPGDNVGVSGFTGSGHPKSVPQALARRVTAAAERGETFRVGLWTGASTAPECDGALFKANGVSMRLPYQSDPECRNRINSGEADYTDVHLSHVAQNAAWGHYGKLNVALIEVVAILEDGRLVPSTAVGNNPTWLELADKVILEVNAAQDTRLEGMHDIYNIALPPHRQPIALVAPADRIGDPYLRVDPEKIVAVVETNCSDRDNKFSAPDENSRLIAGHILDFLQHEVKKGRIPANLLPLQSGVGNIANAVMAGLNDGPFDNLTAYTEVLQDGMLDMIRSGKLVCASATAVSLSAKALADLFANMDEYRKSIILRPQEVSNNPEIIRRLGTISMNGMLEADIYGNVNSTHVMGTRMMNGLGGSGDFARNAYLSIFMTPSLAKDGALSCIVPMVSHVDHTEHDVQVLVTEQGLADLRGLSPRQRAKVVIEKCAHPNFRAALTDYYRRAEAGANGKHTPHLLDEALSWHVKVLRDGKM